MDVLVIDVRWYESLPVATVYSESTGDIFTVNLLHSSYVQRYAIGKGSSLHLIDRRYIQYATPATHGVAVPPAIMGTDRIFDTWFAFRKALRDVLPNKTLRLLFLSGIHTPDDLHRYACSPLTHIKGIGPVTRARIRDLYRTD